MTSGNGPHWAAVNAVTGKFRCTLHRMPRVYVTVPGVESLSDVVDLLRLADAQITAGYREFAVDGPLTAVQASAVWQMAEYVDSGSDGNRLGVRVEPDRDLRAALDVMCPDGWVEDAVLGEADEWGNTPLLLVERGGVSNNQWWNEQQRIQSELKRQPVAPAPHVAPASLEASVAVEPPPASEVERRTDGTCCGRGGTWAPGEGEPVVVGCMLCPRSQTYWRAGRMSGPVQSLGVAD